MQEALALIVIDQIVELEAMFQAEVLDGLFDQFVAERPGLLFEQRAPFGQDPVLWWKLCIVRVIALASTRLLNTIRIQLTCDFDKSNA